MPATFGGSGNTAIGDALIRLLAELAGNGFAGQTKIDVNCFFSIITHPGCRWWSRSPRVIRRADHD